jgi:hypothetical protein
MIIQLFVFGFLFLGFGIFALIKKKKFIGWMFILMGLMVNAVGIIAVYLYPHLLPF